jgi:hypothetical protein
MLPFRALNQNGRIIDDALSNWIPLTPSCEQKETVYCDMKLDESGEINGRITYTRNDYEAYYFRNEYKSYNSHKEFLNEFESEHPGLTINNCILNGIDTLSKPTVEVYDVTLTGNSDVIGDMLSVNPMLLEKMDSNPFKLEKRKYPIDFGHSIKKRIILNLVIPEGYEVAQLPNPCNLVLPDKSAQFTYKATVNGTAIQLMCVFTVNKTLFVESEYQLVKEFYNQVIAKHNEVIMLKKKV